MGAAQQRQRAFVPREEQQGRVTPATAPARCSLTNARCGGAELADRTSSSVESGSSKPFGNLRERSRELHAPPHPAPW